MAGLRIPTAPSALPARLIADEPVEVSVETARKTRVSAANPVWQAQEAAFEVDQLFQAHEEIDAEDLVLDDRTDGGIVTSIGPHDEIWCEQAVRLSFDKGWHAYFAPDDVVNSVQDGRLDPRFVRAIRIGDRVLLIHGQQRQSLYDLIISRVHTHPSIELHMAMIRRWQEDLRLAFQQWQVRAPDAAERREYGSRDLAGLLRRRQARGSHLVAALTLSFWLKGFILCPIDPEDLRRIAEILDMSFVHQYYQHIDRAAKRLRGLHRGLSNRLNRWLEENVTGAMYKNDDDVIDAELGLTFGDVRNSLLVLRVVGLQNVTGPFLRSNLGQAEKDG